MFHAKMQILFKPKMLLASIEYKLGFVSISSYSNSKPLTIGIIARFLFFFFTF